ncbi:hypothetical protein [Streptomyces sp. Amel2xC10]|nr:hypothetical protein [Streptomyces sp. Amel2xC10]
MTGPRPALGIAVSGARSCAPADGPGRRHRFLDWSEKTLLPALREAFT